MMWEAIFLRVVRGATGVDPYLLSMIVNGCSMQHSIDDLGLCTTGAYAILASNVKPLAIVYLSYRSVEMSGTRSETYMANEPCPRWCL